jgi:hypothetical protein
MSFSYDNKVLTRSQWGKRMHGNPQTFQTLSKCVYDDLVAEGSRRTVWSYCAYARHMSRAPREQPYAKHARVFRFIIRRYIPRNICTKTMLAHLCSVPIRWPMPDNTSRDGKEVHELFLLAVYYDVSRSDRSLQVRSHDRHKINRHHWLAGRYVISRRTAFAS